MKKVAVYVAAIMAVIGFFQLPPIYDNTCRFLGTKEVWSETYTDAVLENGEVMLITSKLSSKPLRGYNCNGVEFWQTAQTRPLTPWADTVFTAVTEAWLNFWGFFDG